MFSPTLPLYQLPKHPLYRKIDWERLSTSAFAIVDPLDPSSIMYVSTREHEKLVNVAMSTGVQVQVLASQSDALTILEERLAKEDLAKVVEPGKSTEKKSPPYGSKYNFLFDGEVVSPMDMFRRSRIYMQRFMVSEDSSFKLTHENLRGVFHRWTTQVYLWSGGTRCKSDTFQSELLKISQYLLFMVKKEGVTNTIKRLKVALFTINSYIAGTPLTNTRPLGIGIGLTRGLPSFIPQTMRYKIRVGHVGTIRTITSLCNAYKAISGDHPPLNLETVKAEPNTKSHQKEIWELLGPFAGPFWRTIDVEFYKEKYGSSKSLFTLPDLTSKPFISTKSGPNHKYLFAGAALDAWAWVSNFPSQHIRTMLANDRLGLYPKVTLARKNVEMPLKTFWNAFGDTAVAELFWNCLTREDLVPSYSHGIVMNLHLKENTSSLWPNLKKAKRLYLGKLALKKEAAGKNRIFAMVDYWTQRSLLPLHDYIFSILRVIPQDATFDQEGALQRYVDRGFQEHFCYDLKSATDLIPLELYNLVFTPLLGKERTDAWLNLLTFREFKCDHLVTSDAQVKYTRGQPMGALSSWAGLAIVHHFLVQAASYRVGNVFYFSKYLVLGDDIVISDKEVAESYVELCAYLGIPIGIQKSFLSTNGFLNFANQSYLGKVNLSPASLKEELQISDLSGRIALADRLYDRGWGAVHEGAADIVRSTCLLQSKLELSNSKFVHDISNSERISPTDARSWAIALMPLRKEFEGVPKLSFSAWCSVLLQRTENLTRAFEWERFKKDFLVTKDLVPFMQYKWEHRKYARTLGPHFSITDNSSVFINNAYRAQQIVWDSMYNDLVRLYELWILVLRKSREMYTGDDSIHERMNVCPYGHTIVTEWTKHVLPKLFGEFGLRFLGSDVNSYDMREMGFKKMNDLFGHKSIEVRDEYLEELSEFLRGCTAPLQFFNTEDGLITMDTKKITGLRDPILDNLHEILTALAPIGVEFKSTRAPAFGSEYKPKKSQKGTSSNTGGKGKLRTTPLPTPFVRRIRKPSFRGRAK